MLGRMNVIEVTDLTKRYGDRAAVDGVSFSVEEGEIFGILGPNGAGKTTTVESIAGLRTPDSGTIRVLGLDPRRDRDRLRTARRRPAPGERAARPDDRPRGARPVRLVLRRPGRSRASSSTTSASSDKRDTAYRNLSGGQKQRLSIALALDRPAEDRDPRRALDRPRPAGPPRDLAAHRVDPRPRRHRPARHPPDGGGRAPRRPRRGLRATAGSSRSTRPPASSRWSTRSSGSASGRRRPSTTRCSPTCPRSGASSGRGPSLVVTGTGNLIAGRDLRPRPPPDRRQRPAHRPGEPRRRLSRPHRPPAAARTAKELS